MSNAFETSSEPIEDIQQLIDDLAAGCKPQEDWRIGTEHEKFVFCTKTLELVPYEGAGGIAAIFRAFEAYGWQPLREQEDGPVIAMRHADGASLSLEPGGQFELSGAPLANLHETCAETSTHLRQCREIAHDFGLSFLGLGFNPKTRREDVPWMPKSRYQIMRDYMPKTGKLGLDMMTRTATVQVNLDFADEADMIRKFRVSLALQPIAVALFANSPFTEGQPNGYQSYRSHIWTDTDPQRTGDLPFVFEEDFGFARYVDYMLDVPMYFIRRDGRYIDCTGQSFRAFMQGRLPALPGARPTLSDWTDHLSTAFPEVRLKRFLEMRGADAGPWAYLCALPGFWVGLLYDKQALAEAESLIADWTAQERDALRQGVPQSGLHLPFRGGRVREVAHEAVRIAMGGLARRRYRDQWGQDETQYIAILDRIAETGRSLADELLDHFHGSWQGDIDQLIEAYRYK